MTIISVLLILSCLWLLGSSRLHVAIRVVAIQGILLGMVFVMVLVGVVESILARQRLLQIPKILIGAALLSLIALIVRLMG